MTTTASHSPASAPPKTIMAHAFRLRLGSMSTSRLAPCAVTLVVLSSLVFFFPTFKLAENR